MELATTITPSFMIKPARANDSGATVAVGGAPIKVAVGIVLLVMAEPTSLWPSERIGHAAKFICGMTMFLHTEKR
jgi:hypothetical protein